MVRRWGGVLIAFLLAAASCGFLLTLPIAAEVPMRDYEHRAGFRLPVPAEWVLTEDEPFEGFTLEVVLTGPHHEGYTTNIFVETDRDPTVREGNVYLRQIVDATVQGAPGSFISREPIYRAIAGHAGVTFSITDPSTPPTIVGRFAVVVSEEHDRFWFVALTAHEQYIDLYDATLDQMVNEFQITAPPGAYPELSEAGAIGLTVGMAAVVATFLIAYTFIRKRKPVPPFPSTTRPPYPPAPTVMGGVQFCVSCGTPAPRSYRFCVRCGVAHAPARAQALESVETTPAGSGTPPAPPPPS